MTDDKPPNTAPAPSLKANPARKPAGEQSAPMIDKEEISEFAKTAIIAVLLALIIRTFLYEPFNIPSGSMLPTLEVGDYLFVSKPAYGYSRHSFPFGLANFEGRMMEDTPERGDVIVFKLPTNPSVDYIKRIVGMPGETIQVINGRVYINGDVVEREPVGLAQRENEDLSPQAMMEYIEILPGGIMHRIYEESDNEHLDNTAQYSVPEGHYFVMGDNRDNSQDSRVQSLVGFVPYENIVGRADILFFSVDEGMSFLNPFSWPRNIRYNRIFDRIGPIRPDENLN
ncbi:MAG: signal peptidase I [Alphaproteobacteria bacterium]|nr:signal peptidase I [Alphaproteobacteria bacterium]